MTGGSVLLLLCRTLGDFEDREARDSLDLGVLCARSLCDGDDQCDGAESRLPAIDTSSDGGVLT